MIRQPPPGLKRLDAGPAPEPPPLVSIIVVTYRTPKQTRLCLRALRRYTRASHELIVVDNGSDASCLAWLEARPWLRLIRNPSPAQSHRQALDLGRAAARGEWICTLHSDTFVRRGGWLEALLGYAQGAELLATADRVIWPLDWPWDWLNLWATRRKRARRWARLGRPPKLISHTALWHRRLFDERGLRFDTPRLVDGQPSDCGEAIQRACEAQGWPIRWLGREQLAPWLVHFEAATLNLVLDRRLPLKRRLRAWRFYRQPAIREMLDDTRWDD